MKNNNLRKQAKILVEHILNKDPMSANFVFGQLITEAEEERENEVVEELGFSSDENSGNDVPPIESFGDEQNDETQKAAEIEVDKNTDNTVNDIVEINCQINAKVISNLFDKIAELKNKVENLGLDETSREYLKYTVTIQYYSDKLLEYQNKTNPGVDQGKVEEAVQKIQDSLLQLEGEVSGSEDTEIKTPEEVGAEAGLNTPDETEAETNGDENTGNEAAATDANDLEEAEKSADNNVVSSEADTEKSAEPQEISELLS